VIKIFLLLLAVSMLITGCTIGSNEKFTKLETAVKTQEAVIDSVDKKVEAISERLTALEEKYTAALEKKTTSTDPATAANQEIQIALKNAGYYSGPIDGKIGPKTQAAIKEFQKAKGLTPDGVVGEKTKSLLLGQTAEETY